MLCPWKPDDFAFSWKTMACHSVGWIMARFISELLADRAWTMAKAARRIELAVLPTGPGIPCCTRSMAEYVGIFACMAIPVSSCMLFRSPLYRDFLELCVYDNNVWYKNIEKMLISSCTATFWTKSWYISAFVRPFSVVVLRHWLFHWIHGNGSDHGGWHVQGRVSPEYGGRQHSSLPLQQHRAGNRVRTDNRSCSWRAIVLFL